MVECQGSQTRQLSKQKQAVKAAAAAMANAVGVKKGEEPPTGAATPNIRGIVAWRNYDKSWMIWLKNANGDRVQTHKGLSVKTSKKVVGKDVILKRGEFLKE